MAGSNKEELLKDEQVRQEIDRYKWVESEKAGYDIGFDKAAADWFKLYAKAWESAHVTSAQKPKQNGKKVV